MIDRTAGSVILMDDPVLQTVPLGLHWPTVDPFLFCAHHDDRYPAGDDRMGPAESLEGRRLGMDFEGRDGWRMYHGTVVPGFPQHPHRGFETVTYVKEGICDHSDSLGATARFGNGDVQWLTAGAGIVHSEMFPLRDRQSGNPLELFQIWVNLPAADKMVPPYFTMFWSHDIPKVMIGGEGEPGTTVTVIAGAFGDVTPPAPPPDSWASRESSDLAIWHLHLEPGAAVPLPDPASSATIRTIYVFDGSGVELGSRSVSAGTGAVLRPGVPIELRSAEGADCLILQGVPIGEPVAQQGPFVMNDEAGLRQTFLDYQRTGFGGWPWDADGPVHDREKDRFARFPDGHVEDPALRSA